MSGPKTPGAQAALPDSFDTQRGLVPTPLGKYQVRLKISLAAASRTESSLFAFFGVFVVCFSLV